MHFGRVLACVGILTFVWSWSSGYALAALSPRSIWINGSLFFAAAIVGVPYGLGGRVGAYGQLLRNVDHRIAMAMLEAALFLLPSLWGLRLGMRNRTPTIFALLCMAAGITIPIGLLTIGAGWTPEELLDRLSGYAILSLPAIYIRGRSWRRAYRPAR